MASEKSPRRLDHAAILQAAAALLEQQGRLTMRGLADKLGVDPMAIYHYFPNKEALYAGLADALFERLDGVEVPLSRARSWERRLAMLADAYRDLAGAAPVLIRVLAGGEAPSGAVAQRFARLYELVTAPLGLPAAALLPAQHALVDFVHGYALAGRHDVAAWKAELEVLVLGTGALAASHMNRKGKK